jgi:hypothetical protein
MCDKCIELDGKIEHYRRIASRTTDQAMLDGIKELIERGEGPEGGASSGANGVTPPEPSPTLRTYRNLKEEVRKAIREAKSNPDQTDACHKGTLR